MTNPFTVDDIRYILWNNIQTGRRLQHEFRSIFGVAIKDFWFDNLCGFNLGKFDDEFLQSGDLSMREVVQERYGDKGVNIILQLINPSGRTE